EIRDRRSVFCATFRRLSPPPSCPETIRERPALRCPDFPRAPKGPRSPGLHAGLYPGSGAVDSSVQAHRALRAPHMRALVEDEFTADRALEGCPPQHREELLLERPMQRRRGAHSSRNTPVTLPRIWTCGA